MAEAPAGAGSKKLDPQAVIGKYSAVTQGGAAADAAIITRVESSIQHSPMGWLQSVLGEADSKAASERSQVAGKLDEQKQTVAQNQKDAPPSAGQPPALAPAAHPAIAHPATAGTQGPAAAHQAAVAAPTAHEHAHAAMPAPAKTATQAASPQAAPPAPTIAAAIAGAGSDTQLDAILNAYTPKSSQTTAALGRIKQMGDVAQGFNGQLDTYIAKGGMVEHALAGTANAFGVGKDASAVWASNPYRKMHGVLGGIMTGLSSVRSVCEVVGTICGKLGLILTVIGLLGMIFPPIGVAVSGIARVLNVIAIICSGIGMVLSGILTGLNGVQLAKQISAKATAEEKAATADLMMDEANQTSGELINMAMVFGPQFMKGMLGGSRGIVASLMRRARATIGRVSLKLTGNVKMFATRIARRLGMGGAGFARVDGEWKDVGLVARSKQAFAESRVGQAFYGAPRHLEAVQTRLMAKAGNHWIVRGMDRVGAWGGSFANKFDIEEQIGSLGARAGKRLGSIGAETSLGKSMAETADRAELQTRKAAMHSEMEDAAHLEESRWRRTLAQRHHDNPDAIHSEAAEQKFIAGQKDKVRVQHEERFESAERQREFHEKTELLRDERFERHNREYLENKRGFTGNRWRDDYMDSLHGSRQNRYLLEDQFRGEEKERVALLTKTARNARDDARLSELNLELKPLDDARRLNRMREIELSGMAQGETHYDTPDYENWHDVYRNARDAAHPVMEMLQWSQQDSAWEKAEKFNLSKPLKWDKAGAKRGAAAGGGHRTFEEIAADLRHDQAEDLADFVRRSPRSQGVANQVRGMLGGITSRAPAPNMSVAPAPAHVPAGAAAPARAPIAPATDATPAAAPATAGAPATVAGLQTLAPMADPAQSADACLPDGAAQDAAAAGDVLPYWPALLPEFDNATHDFGWMRKVAVEFRKVQIEGKQKAVDTLAVYGRYKEYAQLRQAAAQQHQQSSQATGKDAQDNASQSDQTVQHASQGEQKQGEAKGHAQDRAAIDLPEPESRGFWDRILGAVKRWAKNKAAALFGWVQEQVASVVLKGLCGVSMGDLREYAGALRRQQLSAHGVACGAAQTAGHAEEKTIKLGATAQKEAQSAADAIGECDRNILDADQFLQDVTSFEQQLAEEKAHAQAFIAQIHAAVHAEQARKQQEQAQHAAHDRLGSQLSANVAAGAAAAGPVAAEPAPPSDEAAAPASDPTAESDAGELRAAASLVASSVDDMNSQLETTAEAYQNDFALAATNRTGKDAQGHAIQAPAKKEAKHIVELFKDHALETKRDMAGFQSMSLDPSASRRIADTIIHAAEHLDADFRESQHHLDDLFARTYQALKDGRRTLKNRVLEGNNTIGVHQSLADSTDHAMATVQAPSAAPKPPATAPVQRKATGDAQVADPGAIAEHGTQGAGGALPHLDAIQHSFGRHDVSGIRAHQGGAAAEASQSLGASAFAVGDAVGFASAPDLHTAAHEAAHVVQQRGGVQLKGGIDGGAGDPYERHADAVADKVVRGESAEALLDDHAGGARGAGGTRAVQRKADPKHPVLPLTGDYCNTYRVKIVARIADRIREVGLVKPHPRLFWADHARAEQAVIDAIVKDVEAVPEKTLHRLMEIVHQVNLYDVVEDARRIPEPKEWHEEVGVAIANEFSVPIDESIRRMGMRLRVQLDGPAHGDIHKVRSLVPSCLLDSLIADVMLTPGIVGGGFQKQTAADDTAGKAFLNGTKEVNFAWAGKEDPALWNWIHVTSKNPTVEDVAVTELAPGKSMGAMQAYRIAASPPYFGLPIEVARQFDEARHYATGHDLVIADGPGDFSRVADPKVLHQSKVSDDAALAQAAPLDPTAPSLDRLLGRCEAQLDVLKTRLGPWKDIATQLGGAGEFVARRRADLAKDPKAANKWQATVAGQERILHAASSEALDVLSALDNRHVKPGAELPAPIHEVLAAYARAAAASHLAGEAQPALADARRDRALLPVALVEDNVLVARDAIGESRNAMVGAQTPEKGADDLAAAAPGLATRAANLKLQAMRGEKMDPAAAEQLNTDADETAMRGRLATLATTVRSLKARADAAGVSSDRAPGGSWSVQMIVDMILDLIYAPEKPNYTQFPEASALHGGWLARLDLARKKGSEPGQKYPMSWWMGPAIRYIDDEMSKMQEQLGGMKSFMDWGQQQIHDAEVRKLIRSLALQIGIMIVTGEVAGAALAAIRGVALAGEIANDVRGAGLLWKGAEVMAHAGMQTVASGAVGGEISGRAFAENALGMVLTSAAMRPFQSLLKDSEGIEQEIRTFGQLAKKSGKVGVEIATGAGSGVLASSVSHAVVNNSELSIAGSDEWTMQGISFAASALVSQRTHAMHERIATAAEQFHNARLQRLAERSDALMKRAAKTAHPSRDEAAAMLAERHSILVDEKAAYDEQGAKAGKQAAQSKQDAATASSFVDVPFQLAGLSPVVDGLRYEGTGAQIEKAFKHAAEQGLHLETHQDEHTGLWTVKVGERELTIKELDFKPGSAKPAAVEHHSRIVLAGSDKDLAEIAKVVKPLPNTVDVIVHGTIDDLYVKRDGEKVRIDHRALAAYIKKSASHIEKVRLLACKAGQHPKGVAQHLANQLGVPVIAPSDTLWIREDGELIIGPRDTRNTGQWLEFEPTKSSFRSSTVPEPKQPERAIDRYHQQKGQQQTRREALEPEEPVSERDRVVEEQRAQLDRASVKLGPKAAAPIERVESFQWDSQRQLGAGAEIGDPLFGEPVSEALKRSAKAPEHRVEVDQVRVQLHDAQGDMLDLLRHPSLSQQQRRKDLGAVVSRVEKVFADHAGVLPGIRGQERIAQARQAITDGIDDSFDQKMTVDEKGVVHHGQERVGSFRQLLDQVVEANRALIKAGTLQEFVVTVSDTKVPGVREVLVLQRPRDTTTKSANHGANKLSEQHDVDQGAAIVDIGSGKGSFGIDMLQAKDRTGGPLVQTEYGPAIFDGGRTRKDLSGWKNAVPRTDENSAVVFGDPLKTMDLMFGEHGVKRVFINNINAHYEVGDYANLASVLSKAMTVNGRVEVQWNHDEFRHHIKGNELKTALAATGRAFDVEVEKPETGYNYSVQPSRRAEGPKEGKEVPSDPVPTDRWIFKFH